MLQRAARDIADVLKDVGVRFKLTTAVAAQAKIDMAKLKGDLKKTPKEAPWEKNTSKVAESSQERRCHG